MDLCDSNLILNIYKCKYTLQNNNNNNKWNLTRKNLCSNR